MMRRSLLAVLALLGGASARGPAEACAAGGECDADAAALLQRRSDEQALYEAVYERNVKAGYERAICPGSLNACAGPQCCPGIPFTNGDSFPCPSMKGAEVKECKVQRIECIRAGRLEPVRHCMGNTCCGVQCQPINKTILHCDPAPCRTADPNFRCPKNPISG
uniref:Uncharacterized protein n=1 Tax=Zooxanthella nutricula TaxID=1333877 RepID=A0A6U9MV80_9DINO|mmetsp:Transcript_67674/g.207334  ORF Transcript_67674/g.207334 Transcript_67674/m.207334 type:complete len:164 (+) Transcript_67674:102-593(+)